MTSIHLPRQMRSFAASLFISLLVTCVSHAASPISIGLTRTLNTGMSPKEIRDADRARFEFLVNGSDSSDGSTVVPATDKYVEYTTRVGIGSPPTYYNLIVDTGSSNTFCGAGIRYHRTSTSISTGQKVNVSYGTGYFSGLEYLDQVTLAPNFTITNQSIGDALNSSYFEGYDGIIGLGPVDLTNGTLSPNRSAAIPTIMNNLFTQGLIDNQVLGVFFSPPVHPTPNSKDGALTFGGIDTSLYQDDFTYTPVTDTPPASHYWGINITSAIYTNHTLISNSTAGIVDTGTSLIYLANDFFTPYMEAIPGAKIDPDTGLLIFPNSSVQSMQPLDFDIGGRTFTLDAIAQLLTEEQTKGWGKHGKRYGVVNCLGHPSGRGLDFIFGKRLMERYYVVFDTDNHRVGIAFTNHTFTPSDVFDLNSVS